MGPLLHTPADILRRLLIEWGVGTDPSPTLQAWPVYAFNEPPSPDNVITCYDTTGRIAGRIQLTSRRIERQGCEVRVRGSKTTDAASKVLQVVNALDLTVRMVVEVTNPTASYLVHTVTRTGSLINLGQEPGGRRWLYTVNCLINVTML